MRKLGPLQQFTENLYRENLRGFHELESMKHALAARLALPEEDALELAVAIVAADEKSARTPRRRSGRKMTVTAGARPLAE